MIFECFKKIRYNSDIDIFLIILVVVAHCSIQKHYKSSEYQFSHKTAFIKPTSELSDLLKRISIY